MEPGVFHFNSLLLSEGPPLLLLPLLGPKWCTVKAPPPITLKYSDGNCVWVNSSDWVVSISSGASCSVACEQFGYVPATALTAARCYLGMWTPATGSCGECVWVGPGGTRRQWQLARSVPGEALVQWPFSLGVCMVCCPPAATRWSINLGCSSNAKHQAIM